MRQDKGASLVGIVFYFRSLSLQLFIFLCHFRAMDHDSKNSFT